MHDVLTQTPPELRAGASVPKRVWVPEIIMPEKYM